MIALALAACEQAPPSQPSPTPITPVPAPRPIPAPDPIPAPKPITLDQPNVLRISPTELTHNGSRILAITPSTTDAELTAAVEHSMSSSTRPHDEQVAIVAHPDVVYSQIIALIDGSKRAGFATIMFSSR